MIVDDLPVPAAVVVEPMLNETGQSRRPALAMWLDVPVLDLLRHSQESLLDVSGVLRRRLQEGDAELVSEFL